jgi:AmmeMemoRadiSam system protein B
VRRQVEQYLDGARLTGLTGEIVALIAPHAGHRYSGRTAGHAFAAVRGKRYDLVAVVSPMHAYHPADLLTTAHKAYGTPLGPVPVDQAALAQLAELLAQDGPSLAAIPYDQEHALEIELPFLQTALQGHFRLLPLMVRSQSPLAARQLGYALAQVVGQRNALLVASTDLSHFYSADEARRLDQEMLRRMSAFSPDALFQAERTGQGFACGVTAVAAVMWAAGALGADRVEILHHSTSGDETGDFSSVVGYGAAAIIKHA